MFIKHNSYVDGQMDFGLIWWSNNYFVVLLGNCLNFSILFDSMSMYCAVLVLRKDS